MTSEPTSAYAERLGLPWWWWVPALGVAALLAAEVHLGADGVRAWLPYVLLVPAAAIGLWWLGRIRVAVVGDEFRVDDARLPARHISQVVLLDSGGKHEILGPAAHPLAFVIQRPWVAGAVQVMLDDPADPTPYWIVSSRRPDRLAAALEAARDATGPPETAPDATGRQPDVISRDGGG